MQPSVEVNIQFEASIESNIESDQPLLPLIQEIATQDWQKWFERWIESQNLSLSPINTYSLGLRFTDDREMQHFNATFRHQDKATDVLAFASLERAGLPPVIWETQPLELGDIIISVETAVRQSREQKHSILQETAWLACHGLLHLLGWDHPTSEELRLMMDEQTRLLSYFELLINVN